MGKTKIQYKNGDIFNGAERGGADILVQACNTRGSWGAGVAVMFKKNYPDAYEACRKNCEEQGSSLVGTSLITIAPSTIDSSSEIIIGSLYTSAGYGRQKGSVESIINATRASMADMLLILEQSEAQRVSIHSPMINAGLFRVPWNETESIIESLCSNSPIKIDWTVWVYP